MTVRCKDGAVLDIPLPILPVTRANKYVILEISFSNTMARVYTVSAYNDFGDLFEEYKDAKDLQLVVADLYPGNKYVVAVVPV